MIVYQQIRKEYLSLYDTIPMSVLVKTVYKIEKNDNGLGGIRFIESRVDEYINHIGIHCKFIELEKEFDLSNWAFFIAFAGDKPVGAASVASKCNNVSMLDRRDDLAVLWDIRVDEAFKKSGIGSHLFKMISHWASHQGLKQLKIECQNNNVPACKFYHKMGAVLSAMNEYAYYHDKLTRHEVQLIWYLDLENC